MCYNTTDQLIAINKKEINMAPQNKGRKSAKNINQGEAPKNGEEQTKKVEQTEVVDQLDAPLTGSGEVKAPEGGETESGQADPESDAQANPEPTPEQEAPVVLDPTPVVEDPQEEAQVGVFSTSVDSAVGIAVQRSMEHFIEYHTGDTASTPKGALNAANNLQRAYVLAITAGDDAKSLLLDIMQVMHDNKAAFNAHTLYQSAPSNDHSFYMAFTQWLYEVTRNPRRQWGKAMGELGHPATQRIMGLSPNPKVSVGFETFINSMYES